MYNSGHTPKSQSEQISNSEHKHSNYKSGSNYESNIHTSPKKNISLNSDWKLNPYRNSDSLTSFPFSVHNIMTNFLTIPPSLQNYTKHVCVITFTFFIHIYLHSIYLCLKYSKNNIFSPHTNKQNVYLYIDDDDNDVYQVQSPTKNMCYVFSFTYYISLTTLQYRKLLHIHLLAMSRFSYSNSSFSVNIILYIHPYISINNCRTHVLRMSTIMKCALFTAHLY